MAKKLHFRLELEGRPAEMVLEKIDEMKRTKGTDRFGKSNATKILLCELWNLKNKQSQNCF